MSQMQEGKKKAMNTNAVASVVNMLGNIILQKTRQKNKEHDKAYWQEYHQNNLDKINERQKHYRENNKEKLKETRQEYIYIYTVYMQKIHHCPLCNYDIKLFQKGITRKITNAPKQPKIKIPNQRRKLHEILLQKIPCFYANYLYTIFLSTGLAPVPPYKFCRTRARPIPTIPPSFLPCFLPSMLPSFHASFLPSLLLSFPPFCFFINANGKCMFVLMQIYGFFC